MFLDNWYKILGMAFNGKSPSVVTVPGNSATLSIAYMNVSSTTIYYPSLKNIPTGWHPGGVVFGDGGAAVSRNDYCLSGNRFTTFAGAASVETGIDDDGVYAIGKYTLTNTGTEDFTIREVGLFTKYMQQNMDNINHAVLVERSILDNPITIPAGGVGQITYTVRMAYPTD